MARVKTLSLAGKSVNVPHLEHRESKEKYIVVFDQDGRAEVSERLAKALVEHYPKDVERA